MYFHRTDTAIEDFKFLVNLYEQDNSILTKSEYETVLNNLIKACATLNRTEESKHYKEKFKALLQTSNESNTSKTISTSSTSNTSQEVQNQRSRVTNQVRF